MDKFGLKKVSSMAALSVRSFVVCGVLIAFLLASGGLRETMRQDPRSLLIIGLGGLLAGLLGQLAYFQAMKLGTTASVVPVVASYPAISAVMAVVVLREPVTPGKVIGVAFIILGACAIAFDKSLWPGK
jgi:transporter family protein